MQSLKLARHQLSTPTEDHAVLSCWASFADHLITTDRNISTSKGLLYFLSSWQTYLIQFTLPLPWLSVVSLQYSHCHEVICVLSLDPFLRLLLSLPNFLLYPWKVCSTANKLLLIINCSWGHSVQCLTYLKPSPLPRIWIPWNSLSWRFLFLTMTASQLSPLSCLQYFLLPERYKSPSTHPVSINCHLHVTALHLMETFAFDFSYFRHHSPGIIWLTRVSKYIIPTTM